MKKSLSSWNLELNFKETSRLPKLQQYVPFERIVEDIANSMTVLCCHPSLMKGTDFSRVIYCVRVDEDLFDLFFNSVCGYRASYFRSPWEGMSANATFLKAVMPKLVNSELSSSCGMSKEFLRESLTTPSAKVWLAEHGKEVDRDCNDCIGEWSASSIDQHIKPEIRNGLWNCTQNLKGKWGSMAPYLTKLRIIGAFLDGHFNELVPFDKRFRARDIHEFGWS